MRAPAPRTSRARGPALALSCLLLGGVGGAQLQAAWAAPPPESEAGDAEAAPKIRPAIQPESKAPTSYSRYRKLDRFARALAIVEQYYVRPVDGEALIDSALHGLVAELDPHTIYLPPAEAKMLLEDTEGRFGGVGLVVTLRVEPVAPGASDDADASAPLEIEASEGSEAETAREPVRLVMHIDDVIPGGPAERAGLEVGDRILAIEGKPIANFSDLGSAVAIMRGEPGTQVSFTYAHADAPARVLTVTRAIVDPPAVEVRWLGEGIGVLRLRDFQEASARELRAGLDELRAKARETGGDGDEKAGEPGRLEGVILDPVYGGKAFHALSQLWHAEPFARMHDVLFIHTGGLHGLYAHAEALAEVVG